MATGAWRDVLKGDRTTAFNKCAFLSIVTSVYEQIHIRAEEGRLLLSMPFDAMIAKCQVVQIKRPYFSTTVL